MRPFLKEQSEKGIGYIMLINVKIPTTVGILTIIRMINKTSKSLKARKVFIFQQFIFYEQLKFRPQSRRA